MVWTELLGYLGLGAMVSSMFGVMAQYVYDEWMFLSEESEEETVLLDLDREPEIGDLCWDDARNCECIYLGECLGADNNVYASIGEFSRRHVEIGHTLPSALHCVSR